MTKIIDMEGIDISLINNGINNAWDLLAKNPESSLFYSLITVLIFPGTEKQFKDRGYEQYFYDMCVKRYNLTNSEINVNSNEKKSQKIIKSNSKKRVFSEEEDF